MAIDTKQPPTPTTPPDPKLIPVKSITFKPGVNLQITGKPIAGNSLTAAPRAVPGEFFSIGFDPRVRAFRCAYHTPDPNLDRAPSAVTMVAESVVATWVPA